MKKGMWVMEKIGYWWVRSALALAGLCFAAGMAYMPFYVNSTEVEAIARIQVADRVLSDATLPVRVHNENEILKNVRGRVFMYNMPCEMAYGTELEVAGATETHVLLRVLSERELSEDACPKGAQVYLEVGWYINANKNQPEIFDNLQRAHAENEKRRKIIRDLLAAEEYKRKR